MFIPIIPVSAAILSLFVFAGILYSNRNSIRKKELDMSYKLSIANRRKFSRNFTPVKVFIRKKNSSNDHAYIEFRNKNISEGGVFILDENFSDLDPGEEIEVLITKDKQKYYEGNARVIHRETVFNEHSIKTESGLGIMFAPDNNSNV